MDRWLSVPGSRAEAEYCNGAYLVTLMTEPDHPLDTSRDWDRVTSGPNLPDAMSAIFFPVFCK